MAEPRPGMDAGCGFPGVWENEAKTKPKCEAARAIGRRVCFAKGLYLPGIMVFGRFEAPGRGPGKITERSHRLVYGDLAVGHKAEPAIRRDHRGCGTGRQVGASRTGRRSRSFATPRRVGTSRPHPGRWRVDDAIANASKSDRIQVNPTKSKRNYEQSWTSKMGVAALRPR